MEIFCGKISPPTLLVDDRSRFMSIELLAMKDQAFDAIRRFQLKSES
jgi:hypothetical protein